jgi:hypothetical protein
MVETCSAAISARPRPSMMHGAERLLGNVPATVPRRQIDGDEHSAFKHFTMGPSLTVYESL